MITTYLVGLACLLLVKFPAALADQNHAALLSSHRNKRCNNVVWSAQMTSLTECSGQCVGRVDCPGVNFHASTRTCQFADCTKEGDVLEESGGWRYTEVLEEENTFSFDCENISLNVHNQAFTCTCMFICMCQVTMGSLSSATTCTDTTAPSYRGAMRWKRVRTAEEDSSTSEARESRESSSGSCRVRTCSSNHTTCFSCTQEYVLSIFLACGLNEGALWTSANDHRLEGTFEWLQHSNDLLADGFTNWGPGEPAHSVDGGDCVLTDGNNEWTWSDVSCGETHPFMCEVRQFPDLQSDCELRPPI